MEILINTLLKYFGYTREDLNRTAETWGAELEIFRQRAENTEQRIIEIQATQEKILAALENRAALPQLPRLASTHAPDASDFI